MALEDLDISEDYAALDILREEHLHELVLDIEEYVNTRVKLNFQQIGIDVFGGTYVFNNDGVQTESPTLVEQVALKDETQSVTGSWTFTNTVGFQNTVSFTGLVNGSIQPRCRAYRATSNQTINDATATAVSLAAESYDIGTMHDNSTNPTRITIPSGTSGSYLFKGQVQFAANATGRREVYIYKNGSLIATNQVPSASAGFDTTVEISTQDNASAGDYYELYAYQNRGGTLDLVFGEFKTFFAAMKVW